MAEYDSIDQAFVETLELIKNKGNVTKPRNMETLEVTNVGFSIVDPRRRLLQNKARAIKTHYAAANVAWNICQRNDVESICFWNENGRRISDDGATFHGANYGSRWELYLPEVITLLEMDPDTRRAWCPIWMPSDLVSGGDSTSLGSPIDFYSRDGKDVPCTIGFGIRIVGNYDHRLLEMDVVMRSQSVCGVLPYDVFLFTTLQELIANELNVGLGKYNHFMLSAHYYTREQDMVDACIEETPNLADSTPRMRELSYSLDEAYGRLAKPFEDMVEGEAVHVDDDPLLELMEPYAMSQQIQA